jgi:hypothetical protein
VGRRRDALRWIMIGCLLLFGAWLALFLMVVRWIPPSLEAALAAYAGSVAGLAVGLWGLFQYVRLLGSTRS